MRIDGTGAAFRDRQPVAGPERPPVALLLLFVASGCAALIYEIVWLQLLQFTIGSSAVSLAVLLGTFMGGMGIGSLWAPRWGGRRHHPLRTYALIELALAVTGLAVLHGLLDATACRAIAARYGIRSIPTLIAFSRGREIARQSGAMDLQNLQAWIKAQIGNR